MHSYIKNINSNCFIKRSKYFKIKSLEKKSLENIFYMRYIVI